MDIPQDFATVIGAAIGVAMVFLPAGWLVFRRIRPWVHVMDDLVGEDARPGRDRQPGLLERMRTNERKLELVVSESAAAKASAWRTEDLMRRHMENGLAIMEVGLHNDTQLHEKLAEHGITVEDLRPYPPVDIADDLPALRNRRSSDG